MLDTDTKRRIDTARNILVGKVPDPKSQVEQITIALIYKFMDDMDAESEEFGGERKFFSGDFAQYGWAKLMRSGLGGHETLALYGEAIAKMPENPGIPLLFREIFKNAYLPYRDPATLRSFLKIIDEFEYDHSERLGDAFEYLLSVLGSQGDAGQFRTPRHIIDFMVEIVDPRKEESVLDPACGTAGFLISSYKHILRANTDAKGNSTLTPDEKGALANNFRGYDISPDMVRLSLVNLYLHGFTDPHIDEYDTLTSDDKWNEFADVILANPPFMSPKGGIKPHKRFSVKSNRSEVLFVDYMAEHLTPSGRAAIIVPEGIIFRDQTAYKQLRKMLVENYLLAVISLPAGVFNPYSPVKTSILILDKSLAKQSDAIAFFTVENDGFSLGAQRREIEKNDLPQVADEMASYLQIVRASESVDELRLALGMVVPKDSIAAADDHNLSKDRYIQTAARVHIYEPVELGEICDLYQPKTITQKDLVENGAYVVFGANGIIGRYDKFNHEEREVLVTCRGATCGTVNMSERKSWITGNAMVIHPKDASLLSKDFLFAVLKASDMSSTISGAAQPQITRAGLSPYKIIRPPLDVQMEIVAEIEGYQKVIDSARAVVDNYRPTIDIDPTWKIGKLGDVLTIKGGYAFKSKDFTNDGIQVIKMGNVKQRFFDVKNKPSYLPEDFKDDYKDYVLRKGDILISMTGTVGKTDYGNVCIIDSDGDYLLNQRVGKFQFRDDKVCKKYFYYAANQDGFRDAVFVNSSGGVRQSNISSKQIEDIDIPIPDKEIQAQIVADLEAEKAWVDGNRKLISRYEKKIQATLARVWGDDESD